MLLAFGGITAFAYNDVKSQANQLQADLTRHLEAAQTELDAAKASLRQANSNHDSKQITVAEDHFSAAKAQFVQASQIADSSSLLRNLESWPAVSGIAKSRHTAVDGIATMGEHICAAGLLLADLDGQLIKPPTSGGQQGSTLLAVLNLTHSSLDKVRTELDLAQKAAATVDVSVVPQGQQATFTKARTSITSALSGIDQFEQLMPVFIDVLGGNGARTYLVLQVNPSELRPGGGFIGTYSLIRTDKGTVKLVSSGDAAAISTPRPVIGQRGYVTPPGPLRQLLISNQSWSFDDSNFFPDFPSNAQTAESFASARLGVKIDGVVSIDYYTVARLLDITGPLPVPGYRLTLNSGNFVSTVVQFDLAALTDPSAALEHKAILSALAGPLMQRLSSLSAERWPALISALNDLATGRHLQAYFNNADAEKAMATFGWSGNVRSDAGQDFMMEVEANLGSTKANYFVIRHYAVTLTRNGGTLHHKVVIDLVNNTPYVYRPLDFYRVYVSLYVSDKATAVSTSGMRPITIGSPPPPAGTRRLEGWMSIAGYGNAGQAVFQYDTPWPAGQSQPEIYWQNQPGTADDQVKVTWNDGAGHSFSASGSLGRDEILTLGRSSVTITPGQAAQAQLPSLGLS